MMDQTGSILRHLMWCAAAALIAVVMLPGAARAQVDFEVKTLVTDPEGSRASVKMVARSPGVVDIAWIDAQGRVRYTQWDITKRESNDGRVIDGELVTGGVSQLLDIGRGRNVVGIGVNAGRRLMMWTRDDDGAWTSSDSGLVAAGGAGQLSGFDVAPPTGLGGFLTVNAEGQRIMALQQRDGTWQTRVIEDAMITISRGDFAFSPVGRPIIAYQRLGSGTGTMAGDADNFQEVNSQSHRYFPLAVATDHRRGIHVLCVLHTGQTNYHRSENGQTWSPPVRIVNEGHYGDAQFVRIAASPDGKHLAATFARGGALNLATSADAGQTWHMEPLPGAGAHSAAVTFDPRGVLYLGFYNRDDSTLNLWVGRLK